MLRAACFGTAFFLRVQPQSLNLPEHVAAFHLGQHTQSLLVPGTQREIIRTLLPRGNLVDVLQFRGVLVVVFVLVFSK